jgi:DNA replication protein DnaC
MDTANEAIRLKSLIFWLDWYQRVDDLSMVHRYWRTKDLQGYRSLGICHFCKGSPAFDLTLKGEPVILHGIHIERVQCYCLTLEHLSRTQSRWYESHYTDSYLKDLKAIDIPLGAAKRTESIKGKLERFMFNPSRSALINGGTGAGKSHILQALKTHFGGFAVYISFADFFQKLMQYTAEGKAGKFIDALTYTPILLFDDFGLQHRDRNDYGLNTIASIIDNRYNRKRLAPTIMTTNMSLVEMQQTEGVSIGNLERILSRMMDSDVSTVMTVTQADYRQKQTKKEAGL